MPWARLDDRLNDDAKFRSLSDGAFRLWICGLVYCQKNLTDGFIPEHEVETFKVRAKRSPCVVELCTPLVQISKGPLWHRVETGYQMHDYLHWNDSREKVVAERAAAKERQDRFKGKKRFRVVANAVINGVRNALHLPFETAIATETQRVSTYHVPRYVQKQEREDASAQPVDRERINRLNSLIQQHRRRRSRETDDGKPARSVITALARDVLETHPLETDDGELRELLKAACARANLRYDGQAVGAALEAAKAQVRRTS